MARWRELPAGLDPAVARLVVRLRELKDLSGRTLQKLAADTGYSVSSWERYLSGRALPPREAVEALARTAGADAVRLLVLYDAAAEAQRRGKQTPAPSAAEPDPASANANVDVDVPEKQAAAQPLPDEPEPLPAESASPAPLPAREPGGAGGRGSLWRTALAAVAGAAVGVVVTLLVVSPGRTSTSATAAQLQSEAAKPVVYTCTYSRKGGLWYAGNSTTTSQRLVVDMSGPDVAELQCLLQRAGITPGGIDGNFGPLTEAAVIQAQKTYHLDVDGQVGPHTWAALRG
jgi:transcriptional regulator with XRE-family HTH domain